jgi:hypothetical protein
MHWLYFSENAPETLEAAGFDYDSTCGFNDAVGYKAGTSQSFRLPGTRTLMELPLTIMDSALFYRTRMGFDEAEAAKACRNLIATARRHGGTLVINWHDRSLAPERLWGTFYKALLDDLSADDARPWFATAKQAVEWFRSRRSIRFSVNDAGGIAITRDPSTTDAPAPVIRIQRPGSDVGFEDRHFDRTGMVTVHV